jgi:hypothetical protein
MEVFMTKQVLLMVIVAVSLFVFSCELIKDNTAGQGITGAQDKVILTLYLYQKESQSRATDVTTIEHEILNASITATDLFFLDSSDDVIKEVTVDSSQFETRVEVEFTIEELAAIIRLRVENNWAVDFAEGTERMVTDTTVELIIESGYNLLTINIGTFYGVGVFVHTTEDTYTRGELEVMLDDDVLHPDFLYDFGSVSQGETGEVVFTIENKGDGELTVSKVTLSGVDASSFSVTGGEGILARGEITALTAAYSPVSTGTHRAEVTITSDDLEYPGFRIVLTGNSYRYAADEVVFTAPGEHTWTAPDNIVEATATVTLVGAGGGGGGRYSGPGGTSNDNGKGGEAGTVITHIINITASQIFTITVGSGGAGGSSGTSPGSGGKGGDSHLVSGDINLTAEGGYGGAAATGGNSTGETNRSGYGSGGQGGSVSQSATRGQNGMVSIVWSGYTE